MLKPFNAIDASSKGFQRSLRKFAERAMAEDAILDMLLDPMPSRFDFKKLKKYKNPNIYSVTISGNHAFKISFEIANEIAILRRVGTHKQIDDNP